MCTTETGSNLVSDTFMVVIFMLLSMDYWFLINENYKTAQGKDVMSIKSWKNLTATETLKPRSYATQQ